MPEDKFDVKAFSFNTQVNEIDLKTGRVHKGYGTSFGIIESHIQRYISKNKIKYPKAVFILTDGYGNTVNPKHPERWYWFLTESYKNYIPNKSKSFNLKDYE